MMQTVCAVRDSASGVFGRPVFVAHRGQAVRSFTDEVRRDAEGNDLNRHPEDFELYVLAQFDDNTGRFHGVEAELLVRGKDCVLVKE